MKRIILLFVLIILYIIIISSKCKNVFSEKVDLNLNQGEIGIILYDLDNLRFLLFKDDNINTILLMEDDNSNRLKNVLNIFDSNSINNYISNYSVDLKSDNKYKYGDNIKVNNIEFIKTNDLYKFKIYDYSFCIYDNSYNSNLDDCTFIYFYQINYNILLNENNKVVFYNENINESFKELVYTKWIDTYEFDNENYIVLKVKKDNYNIINIPF